MAFVWTEGRDKGRLSRSDFMYVSVYITAKDVKEARKISLTLLREHLIACANIIPKIESLYWWKGAIAHHGEAAIIAKSKAENAKKIIKRVKELHSDEVPCVVFWQIVEGNKDYLDWVRKETK